MSFFNRREWIKSVVSSLGLATLAPGGLEMNPFRESSDKLREGPGPGWVPKLGSEFLVKGRYVLTNDPSKLGAGLIEDGAVWVSDGKIKDVGAREILEARHEGVPALGGAKFLVLPGLIDAHTHGKGLTHLRLGANDEPLDLWALNAFSQRQISPYLDAALQNIMLAESGVTTVLHSHYPRGFPDEIEQIIAAFRDAGLRVAFALPYFDQNFLSYDDREFLPTLPNQLREEAEHFFPRLKSADSYVQAFESYLKYYQGRDDVRMLHGPIGAQWVSLEALRRIRQQADATNTGIHMHLLETYYQRQQALRQYKKTWVEVLREIGFLGPRLSVAHAVWSTEEDISVYAKTGTVVCTNPSSNLRLKSGVAPVLEMRDGGVHVALGSDNMVLGGIEDFLWEMRICANLHRSPGLDAPALTSSDVLQMATINSAETTTFPRVGWIGEGQFADIVLLRTDRILSPYLDRRIPILDVVLYQASAADVETVIVGGNVIVSNGKHVHLDKDKILESIRAELTDALEQMPAMERVFMDLKPFLKHYYEKYGPVGHSPHYDYVFNRRD